MSETTIREARAEHFKKYGLPVDGGYENKWVPLKFGFLTVYLYNSKARKRAVKLHDIHHVITEYTSDPRGEAEISAWELAAGIHDKHFARFINLAGLFYGAYIFPKTTFKAFVRGKYSATLYNQEFSESLLENSVAELKQQLLPQEEPIAKLKHYFEYAFLVAISSLPALFSVFAIVFLMTKYF